MNNLVQKIIFLDIDGTLTQPGSNVPPYSALDAIKRAQQNGHKILLNSGRNYGMLRPLLKYNFDGVSACNGGYILYGETLIFDCPMTPEQQLRSMEILAKNGVFRTIESRDKSYTDEGFKIFLAENVQATGNSELLRWREQIEKSLGICPMSEYNGEPIYKIVFMSRGTEPMKEPIQLLQDDFDFCIQDMDQYGIVNGELINKKFNKGMAIQKICDFLSISIENTIAFGDSMNDLEMLQTAGLGICMENGSKKLKELADEVCPSVNDDGLYKAFKHHGLIY